jgi:2-C-methyl-D-erythritol 4-phosphate cytidylyltransferase
LKLWPFKLGDYYFLLTPPSFNVSIKTVLMMDSVGAIIAAAGEGYRMGGVDKIFASIAGKPLLAYVLDVFDLCPSIQEIVVVLGEQNLERGQRLISEQGYSKVINICPGGKSRQHSVTEGLKHLSGCQWVVIHDGARPCLTSDLVERGIEEAKEHGAACAAVKAVDTIKVVGADGVVRQTPDRGNLYLAQTPQVFRFDIITQAHRQAREKATDDAALVEALGCKVKIYLGSYENIKVTTKDDLALAETILRNRKGAP